MSNEKKGIQRMMNLTVATTGYISNKIGIDKIRLSDTSRWHFYHKPYQCDFPAALLNRVR